MGSFIKNTTVKVGIIGVEELEAQMLVDRLTTITAHDPGTFEVKRFTGLKEGRSAVNNSKVNAICIALEKFGADESIFFINEIRVTHPLVPVCLVGTETFLKNLPGFNKTWSKRLSHYYRLISDVNADDFSENAGLLRDLFVADSIKCRALGQYETTPGAVVRLQAPRPYGFWLLIVVALLAALVGGAIGPVLERVWPASALGGEAQAGGSR